MTSPVDETAERFAFGRNWDQFSHLISEERIAASVEGLRRLLRCDDLSGKTFLDIGCGSGLSSLAALRLGATVRAFDFDADSVATTRRLLDKAAPPGARFTVLQGSVLDTAFMDSLGRFDVVYSWGVLHHTGAMWPAIEAAAARTDRGGRFALALYNDQGGASRRWLAIKRLYVDGSRPLRWALVGIIGAWFEGRAALIRLVRGQNPLPLADWRGRSQDRGMSVWHDLIDWVGGYPFEVAKPEAVFEFLRSRGFQLDGLSTCAGGHGCNEFCFVLPK